MRVAVAFILLFSIAFAFTIEKERPVFEDEADEQQFWDIGGENEPEVQKFAFNSDENEPEVQKLVGIGDENEPEVQKFVGIGDESQENTKVESSEKRFFGQNQNYCCKHVCFYTPPECYGVVGNGK